MSILFYLEMLKEEAWNAKVTFDGQRVFVQFHQEGNTAVLNKKLPGRICFPVYLAMKQKQLRINHNIQLLGRDVANRYINQVNWLKNKLTSDHTQQLCCLY